jgi:MoxR-like ATPase/DNA-binding transcriptional MerR regulator
MPSLTITKQTTWEEFEAGVEEAHELIQKVGLPTEIDKTRADLLQRFAQKEGITPEEAENLLKGNSSLRAPAPEQTEPETEEQQQQREEQVAEASKELAKRQTSAGTGRPYFYTDPQHMSFLKMVTTMRQQGGIVANVLFTGPTGCGKTTLAQEVGAEMGIPVHIVNCPSITSDEKWVGHKEFREGKTEYVLSEMLRWISTPGDKIVLFDELTRLHPTRHNLLFPLLDNQQNIWVPELDIHVQVQDTYFWATANVGVNYTGTHRMDAALAGRFGYRLELDFPKPDQEITILQERTGIEKAQATILVDIATMTRQRARTNDLDEGISTRNLLDAGVLVAAGMGIPEAAEYTFVKFYSEEGGASSHRAQVRQMVTGKAAGRDKKTAKS